MALRIGSMSHRLKALFLLFVFGMILPAAGSAHRFCTVTGKMVTSGDCPCAKCPKCAKDSQKQDRSECMITVKPVADSLVQHPLQLPPLAVAVIPEVELPQPYRQQTGHLVLKWLPDPAPPDPLPIYLRHQWLLI
ncbi:hypothetical protein JIN85_09890 [Luteolibacter pohnpeiensis]|uniref:Uncharacterized protein n=1 Tax=Luteolibacter pohnpeiensis TaxID=454153 RepID=A0A934VUN5_9BACT|nr:hypothetical protein [Luteolibacter pohnpeiensis]MBK1882727.1 hypothetical protein [Luteolibacter pohnpeiensis]